MKVFCRGGRYNDVRLEKSAGNLYAALADVVEHMLKRLNRFGNRSRVKARVKERRAVSKFGLTEREPSYDKSGS